MMISSIGSEGDDDDGLAAAEVLQDPRLFTPSSSMRPLPAMRVGHSVDVIMSA
jgi:hypothetical protein